MSLALRVLLNVLVTRILGQCLKSLELDLIGSCDFMQPAHPFQPFKALAQDCDFICRYGKVFS